MAERFQIEKPELKSPSTRDLSRPFSSRYFGLFLLGSLGITWILDFIILVTIPTQQNPANNDLNAELLAALSLAVFWFLFISIDIFAFLLWIYKVHQDLGRLLPHYPISPGRAVANVAIPFYNLYGVWKVFSEMGKSFVSQLDIWIRLLYLAPILSRSLGSLLSDAKISDLRGQLLTLSLTAIFFIITMKVHRALAGRFADLPSNDTEAAEWAADPRLTEPTAVSVPAKTNPESHKPRNRWLITGVVGFLLTICTVSACALVTVGASNVLRWFDWNYWEYVLALDGHYAFDDSVATFLVEISFIQNDSGESEVWLVINAETPMDCGARVADPCEQLANEIAAFTLQNYARIDEMDSLSVTLTTVHGDETDQTTIGLEKNMSIAEWRRELRVSNKLDA